MMRDRRYSVSEIDRMRDAIRDLMTAWRYFPSGRGGTAPSAAEVEERLRTYMLHGTDPYELETEAAKRHEIGMAAAKEVGQFGPIWATIKT